MRAIDADYLIKRLDKCDTLNGIGLEPVMAIRDVKALISVMPTVDAVPVKHGRWVMDEEPHDGDVRCSVCRIAIDQMHERNHELLNTLTGGKWHTFYHYCPHCGAKMDLEEQDADRQ